MAKPSRKQAAKRPVPPTGPQGRHRAVAMAGGVVAAALVIAIIVVVIRSTRDSTDESAAPSGTVVAPAGATASGAIAVGDNSAPVRVEVFLDYMCPYCGRFERANSTELHRLVEDKTVRLELYPLSFLDDMSRGTRYSTRAANAVATVADRAPDKLLDFNAALFAQQPAEQTTGLPDDQIAALARGAGVPDEVVAAFGERVFVPWIARSTESLLGTEITGTPTVRIDGARFEGDLFTAGPLTQAVLAAKE
jgi:protein-disulfide isomerase